jgi:hypothetical protein
VNPDLSLILAWLTYVNDSGAVSDQKISKFFMSHMEKPMAGHMGVNGVY